jgi:hypothetical protein
MEIQYTCGHRQVTQLYPDGKYPNGRYTLGPGESVQTLLGIVPDRAEVLVIDPSGPIEVTGNEYTRELTKPLIWQNGNGILFPFGESAEQITFELKNPSETETVSVMTVAVDRPIDKAE